MKKENGADQGKFPDLSGDGEVTMKDILIGRGVVKKASKAHAAYSLLPDPFGFLPEPVLGSFLFLAIF